MHEELSWGEVVEVMKCLKSRKAAGSDRIMNKMSMYGGEWLVEIRVNALR